MGLLFWTLCTFVFQFKSNRTFQNAYQIQVVFNIAEPDIIEECKNFEFSVTLEVRNVD